MIPILAAESAEKVIALLDQCVALAGVFGLGMCFAILGSISIKLMPRLKIDQGKFGTLVSLFMLTCLIASLIMGVLLDNVGFKVIGVAGFLVTAASIFLLARGKNFGAALLACILLGFGAMALNTIGNVLIPQVLFGGAEEKINAALNLGNVFFGLGLFVAPFLISFLLRKTTFENAIMILGIIPLVLTVFPALAPLKGYGGPGFEFGTAAGLLAQPATIIAALVLFCYIALEASFCSWLAPYGKEIISAEKPDMAPDAVDASAQRMLSVFAIAMMAGRLITGLVTAEVKIPGQYIIAASAVVSIVIILIMMKSKKSGSAWIMAALAGFVFGPCFPTTIGVSFAKLDKAFHGSFFGIIFAIGLLGAVLIPKMMGNMAAKSEDSSIRKSLKLLLPMCVILVILAIILGLDSVGVSGAAAPK
jgi:FHS family L-fucose permease-like MFS transporter